MKKRNYYLKSRRLLKQIVAGVLAAALVCTSGGMPAYAGDGSAKQEDSVAAGIENVTGGTINNETASASDLHNPIPHFKRDGLKSPVYHSKLVDGKEVITFDEYSYVWFGSYPQEVVDTGTAKSNELVKELEAAFEKAGIQSGDLTVDGVKYRRIQKSDTNREDNFYKYSGEREELPTYRYFKWKPIKWRVLQVDGNKAFLCAEKALDSQEYNEEEADVTWETCSMRKWLNGYEGFTDLDRDGGKSFTAKSFYETAFTEEEQKAILETTVENKDHSYESGGKTVTIPGGNDTTDKIFLLSTEEVTNKTYGFDVTTGSSYTRQCSNTQYSSIMGSWYEVYCWLRTAGSTSSSAANVYYDGNVYSNGIDVNDFHGIAVVPALYLNLDSDTWTVAGKDDSEPIPDTVEWSSVYFGSYPQTEVTDKSIIAQIDAKLPTSGDVWVNGVKYRKISCDDTNYGEYFYNKEYDEYDDEDTTVYYRYFKWERIRWKVLNTDGSKAFLVAVNGLDCQEYNEEYADVTWETCSMRKWLNGYDGFADYDRKEGTSFTARNFMDTAFEKKEQGAILQTTLKNADNPDYGTAGGNSTNDKVFLLSLEDVQNDRYGYFDRASFRWVKTTDYGRAVGADTNTGGDNAEYKGNTYWWLRTAGSTSSLAAIVYDNGYVYSYGNIVYNLNFAVVPALYLNLASSSWTTADDGTSGTGGGSIISDTPKPDNPAPDNPTPDNPTPDNPTPTNPSSDKPSTGTPQTGGSQVGTGQTTTVAVPTTLKVKKAAKSFKATWKKIEGVDGYELQYSLKKDMKSAKKKKLSAGKKAVTVSKLKSGKKYYVRLRAYKIVNGQKVYSEWGKTKKVTVK